MSLMYTRNDLVRLEQYNNLVAFNEWVVKGGTQSIHRVKVFIVVLLAKPLKEID